MKEMADIRTDFLKQQRDLQRDFSRGEISEDLYKQQTEALQAALAERLAIQEDYYKKPMNSSQTGARGSAIPLMNYADQAADLSSMSATATSEILNNVTNSISTNMTDLLTGATSFKDGMSNIFMSLGETVIKTLIQMATQALITKAIMASFGGGAGGMFGSLLVEQVELQVVELRCKASDRLLPLMPSVASTIRLHFPHTAAVYTALRSTLLLRKERAFSVKLARKRLCP